MKHIKQLQMLYLDPLNSKNSQLFTHVEFDQKVKKLYIQKLKELAHLKLDFLLSFLHLYENNIQIWHEMSTVLLRNIQYSQNSNSHLKYTT